MFKPTMRKVLIGVAAVLLITSQGAWAQDTSKISLIEHQKMQRMLEQQINGCIAPIPHLKVVRVKIRVHMNRNGTLSGAPVIISATSLADGANLVSAFTRCITPKKPLKFAPEKYAVWKEFNYSFTHSAQ